MTFFHFSCSRSSQGSAARMFFYNNKILPLADCSPNVTFSTVSAPVCQKTYIFAMNFNNSCLSPISSILHRCARVTFPMVWRTRRFVAVKNAIYYQRFLTISLFANMRPSKFLLSPLVLATFSFCIEFLVHRHDPSPSIIATFFSFSHEHHMFWQLFGFASISWSIVTTRRHQSLLRSFNFCKKTQCFFQCFHLSIIKRLLASLATSARRPLST